MSFEMERRKTDPSVDSRAQENWLLDGNGDITPKADESVRQSSVTEEEKILGEPLALQEMKKKEDEETLQSVPFFKLFSFADYIDVLLMIVGTVSSLASGVGMSLMTLLFGQLVNAFGETANTNNVVHEVSKVSLRFVYLGIGTGVASFLQVSCWMVTGSRQAARIRSLYLKTILSQDIAFFDTETNTGAVVERMSGDTVLIQDAMGEKVGKFIQQMSTFIGGFVIAFTRGWLLTLIMLSFVPLLILAGATMSMVIAKAAARGQASYTTAGFVVEQTIGSIRTVASYGGEERAINKYKKSLMSAYKSSVHEGLASGLGLGSFLFIIFCSHALVVWYAAKLIMNKGYTGGDVITIIVAVMAGSTSAGQTSPCVKAFAAGQAAAFKMFETINRKPEIDANDPNGRKLDDIRGDIELRNIYFSYPARPDEQIFSGFSLHIPSGMTAALVGESGSGKSTVISLIERFYDPQVGEVLIDGINLKEFQLKWIREKIGLVGQDPVLFACSIKDNIAYGKDGATVEEIKAAVKLANAATFIEKMPQGLDTLVGEHGTQMSGGQKQRIAIARAILKDPCILLLDEATSALDAVSEQVVQEALDRVMINRTTVIVAHRLSTVRNADMIAVIHRGKIIEKGSHSEMLKDPNGAYSQLIRLQEVKKEPKQQAVHDQNKMEITTDSGELSRQQSFRPSVILRSHSLSGSLHVADFPETVEPESDTPPRTKQPSDVPLLRLAYLNKPEFPILLLGVVAAVMNGVIQPIFGLFISSMIQVFYEPPPKLQKDARFWALMFIVLAVASLAASLTQMYFFAMAGGQLIKRIRSMLFEKVVHMEIGWFDSSENSSGTIGARLSVDSAAVRGLVGDTLALIVQIIAAALAGLVIAFAANWELSLIVLALLPFLGVSTWAQVRLTKGFSADAKVMYQEASQVAKEAVGSVRTVASFCAEEKVMELYRRKSEGPAKAGIRQGMISGIGFGISLFLMFGVHAIAFYAGARLVQDGKMTFTDVFRVFYALTMAANGVSQSSTLVPDATKAKVSAASIFSILDRQSKIDPADDSGAKLEDVKGEIEFQHVSFRYPSRPDVNIFQDLCLSVQSGKTVALVGESGSGKSTVISLLQRFYDPDSGRITLDGIEISKLQLRWLRQQMGLVSQEPVLFNDTIRANIAYGNGQATEAEILAAAESANAHKFISGLQQGYETMVGERGVQLSGGQKQRVAIARALVKRPKILLLDEATSALDAESEQVVQEALDGVMVGRTTIVVAHRLSTIKNADIIGVVKNGVIVEKGRHEDLINIQGGIYASLVALHSNASSK